MSKYVPHHAPSAAYAKELTADLRSPLEKYTAITSYVSRMIRYDYIRAIKIPKKGGLPDVPHVWQTHMGICLDTAALTVGMLRAVGLQSYLCIGHADRQYHAWVETTINGTTYRYDHDGKAATYKTERRY